MSLVQRVTTRRSPLIYAERLSLIIRSTRQLRFNTMSRQHDRVWASASPHDLVPNLRVLVDATTHCVAAHDLERSSNSASGSTVLRTCSSWMVRQLSSHDCCSVRKSLRSWRCTLTMTCHWHQCLWFTENCRRRRAAQLIMVLSKRAVWSNCRFQYTRCQSPPLSLWVRIQGFVPH